MRADLVRLMQRDLDGLRRELAMYPDDASVWRDVPGCPNSGGTLALHLVGNLRHFIGAQMGATGYVRNREAEFSSRGVPREDLYALIDAARDDVTRTLEHLDAARFEGRTTLPTAGGLEVPTSRWLLHLATHLAYHLGQVDYHRRAVTGDASSAGVIPLPALAD